MHEKEKPEKKPLVLDWDKLLPTGVCDEDQPLPFIVPSATTAAEAPKPSPMSFDYQSGFGDNGEIQSLSDRDLEEKIRRLEGHAEVMALKLPDKGEKIRAFLKRLLEERERRKLCRPEKGIDECKKPTQSDNSIIDGAPNGSMQDSRSLHDHLQSSFGKEFSKRIDKNSNFTRVNASDKGFSNLGRYDLQKKRSNGHVPPNARTKRQFSPKQRRISFSSNTSLKGGKFCHQELNSSAKKRNAFQVLPSKELRANQDQTFILVDEEDYETAEAEEHVEELTEFMKDATIYYPSRDDPDPVIICYADVDCLAPAAYLRSTVMNFYIRYLQQQVASTSSVICDYLFFNTYFYEKLREAVTCKETDKNSKFVKFRRWWKGVNVFQKAYILIPIHQDLHWSLVIICIPDKEDESGPIILHLDSLGLHFSRSIFDNIKSFMTEEWNCLNQEIAPTDLPIAENIWKHLPDRIEEKKILVPRQRNDYDCGLFVLYFMKLFIEEAPERLMKEKDLRSMFGRRWFKPEEASGLRKKIRSLLREEFHKANEAADS